MKYLNIILGIIGGTIVVLGAIWGVFRWTDSMADTDTGLIEWQQEEKAYREEAAKFQQVMIQTVNNNTLKLDSLMQQTKSNYRAIHGNRTVIINQIQKDTSLTAAEAIELMRPFMEEIKKNSGWTPYATE